MSIRLGRIDLDTYEPDLAMVVRRITGKEPKFDDYSRAMVLSDIARPHNPFGTLGK